MSNNVKNTFLDHDRARSSESEDLAQFVDSVQELFSDPSKTFWDCEEAFRALHRTTFAVDLVNQELQRIANDNSHEPRFTATQNDLRLVETPDFTLGLRIQPADYPLQSHLYSSICDCMIGPLGDINSIGVTIECFEQPEFQSKDTVERPKKLLNKPERFVGEGEIACFRADRDVFQILPSGHSTLLLVLQSAPLLTRFWEYDISSLLPVRVMTGSHDLARLDFAAQMLARFGSSSSIPALKSLQHHPEHFLRWSAIRALARIDATEGLAALHEALNDIHPQIRKAAARELEQVSRR